MFLLALERKINSCVPALKVSLCFIGFRREGDGTWRSQSSLWALSWKEEQISRALKRTQMCNIALVRNESKSALQEGSQNCGAPEETWLSLLGDRREGQMMEQQVQQSSLRRSTEEEPARHPLWEGRSCGWCWCWHPNCLTEWMLWRDGSPERTKASNSTWVASVSERNLNGRAASPLTESWRTCFSTSKSQEAWRRQTDPATGKNSWAPFYFTPPPPANYPITELENLNSLAVANGSKWPFC